MVRRAFRLMYSEIRGLHQAAYLLALFALGSQMLAIVRDRTLAHTFGAGGELDLYYAAFRIPDLLFVLFASVLSVYVLLPFVDRARTDAGGGTAARVLGQCFTLFLYVYVVVAGLLALFAPNIIPWLFPGLADQVETLTTLTRVLLLQPFLLGISSLFGVITQSERRFVLYALSPILYNVGIIIGVLAFYPTFGLSGLVWGVIIGAAGHMLVQYPLVRRSELMFSLVPVLDWKLVKEILQVAVPRAITLSIHQLTTFVLVGMATAMTVGSVAVFQFALNLQSVPLAVIGMSYSVAAFPMLAELIARKDHSRFNEHVLNAIRHIIFWSLPITGLVIVLRAQLVRTLFGSGSFDWSDTRLTAAIVAIFIISLVAQSLLLLLVRAFYASSRMVVPLFVSLFGVAVTVTLAVVFTKLFTDVPAFAAALETAFRLTGVPGTEVLTLALAYTCGVLLEVAVLFIVFMRTFGLTVRSLWRQCVEGFLAAVCGATTAYLTLNFIVDGINQETFIGVFLQGTVAGAAGLAAVILCYVLLGSRELSELYCSFRARLFKADVIAPQNESL